MTAQPAAGLVAVFAEPRGYLIPAASKPAE